MTCAASSARPSTPPTPTRSAAAMPRWPCREGAKRIAVGRDGRTHSPELEAALIEGLTAGGLDVVRIGMGPSPMLYFAVATLDVDGGIQVTGSHNPADYNGFKMLLNGRSVFGAGDPGPRPPRRRRRLERGRRRGQRRTTSSTIMSTRWSRASTARPIGSAGTPATAPAARSLEKLVKRLPGEHHTLYTEVDGTLPQPPPRPDGRGQSRRPEEAGRRQGPRLRHRLRRRRRPHRRGRWPGPRDLGRPAADHPRRPGAQGPARRDDHRRRQGQPDPVRPHRRNGRHAADVEHRPQPDQVEDEGNRRAAGGRDERPHLLQASNGTASTTRSTPRSA